MKNFLIITLVLLSTFSFAQESETSPWSVYAGLTSAGFDDSDGRTTGLSALEFTENKLWDYDFFEGFSE